MHPTLVKHEYEIADALEKVSEQERTLRAHGDDYKLNAAFKVTALRVLMSCKGNNSSSSRGNPERSTATNCATKCSMIYWRESRRTHNKGDSRKS